MAAEILAGQGLRVTIFDAMATPGRKFLMAGRGGLNLTHSEALPDFVARYGANAARFAGFLARFSPADLRSWADGLGAETFVGSSGRIFPRALKASGLLRNWLARLAADGVAFHLRHKWFGFSGDDLLFIDPTGTETRVRPRATLLALGGASWPKLGSDATWVPLLAAQCIAIAPFRPSNCGFDVAWSPHFRSKAAGQPLKNIALSFAGRTARGEMVLTERGIEGGAVYALSGPIRDDLERARGSVEVTLDLRPDLGAADLALRIAGRRTGRSLSGFLARDLNLPPVTYALLREFGAEIPKDPTALAARLKHLSMPLQRPGPIAKAISSAGGVAFSALNDALMLNRLPGVFVAGEMLDWEAPTGGYLLQGCLSTAAVAADGIRDWLAGPAPT